MLKNWDFRPDVATGGVEAIDLLEKASGSDPFQLIILDLMMPKMSGPELARRFAKSKPLVPVLFVSGYTDGAMPELQDMPARHRVLGKPFEPDEFLSAIHEALTSASSDASQLVRRTRAAGDSVVS